MFRNMNADLMKRQQTAIFLLVLWGLICLSNIVFRHAHRLPDGSIISHVHPYAEFGTKCNFPAHQHTQSELLWLDCVSHIPFDSFLPELTFFIPEIWETLSKTYVYEEKDTCRDSHAIFLRGPPVQPFVMLLPFKFYS
jgi:hypothetical protein